MPIHDRMTATATSTNWIAVIANFGLNSPWGIRWKFNITLSTYMWPWKGPFNGFILELTNSWPVSISIGWCNNDPWPLPHCSDGRKLVLFSTGYSVWCCFSTPPAETLQLPDAMMWIHSEDDPCDRYYAAPIVGESQKIFRHRLNLEQSALLCPRRNTTVETMAVWQFLSPL